MRKVILILVLVFSYFYLNAYSISGYTNFMDSPIEGAVVELHSQPGMNMWPDETTTSNSAGYYHFDIDYPGMYFVSAVIDDPFYQYVFYDSIYVPFNATPIHLSNMTPNQENINFDFQPNIPGGNNTVTGLVSDEFNQPIENVIIKLNPAQYSCPWLTFFSVQTDENGIYNLANIPDGNYLLKANHPSYYPYFYNGAPSWQQAEIIHLEDGSIEEINIVLESNDFYTISGYVEDSPNGLPISGAFVYALPQDGNIPGGNGPGGFMMDFIVGTEDDGSYTLSLPEDNYLIMARDMQTNSVEFFDNAATPLDATWLNLDQNIENINFVLNENLGGDNSVSGTLSVSGNNPDPIPMLAVAVSSDEEWEETVATESTGGYEIPDLPGGEYYIYAFSPIAIPTFFEDAINYEDAVLLNVQNNVSGIDIDMHIAQETGYLGCNGFVLDETGEPVVNATVAFIDPFGNVQDYAYSDTNGEYDIPALNSLNFTAIATKVFYSSDQVQLPVSGNLTWNFTLIDPNTEVGEELPQSGNKFNLKVYPNPFNPTTTISFDVTQSSNVDFAKQNGIPLNFATIEIYNLIGQRVKTFSNLPINQSSNHQIVWHGDDENKRPVSSGVYLVRIKADDHQESKKVLLLK